MNFWGFSISEARVIDYDKNDKSLVTAMTADVPSTKLCIGCGGCTATCTAGNLTEFNIRKLQMLVKRATRNQLWRSPPPKMYVVWKMSAGLSTGSRYPAHDPKPAQIYKQPLAYSFVAFSL